VHVTRWHQLEPLGQDFFRTAPYVHRHAIDLPVPAEQVWASLTGATPLSWCRLLTDVRYTSAAPHGVGTTRTAVLAGGVLRLRERFTHWEEGHHQSFHVEQASLPVFRRFGEDYLVEKTPSGTRFTWTFAYEPSPAFRHLLRVGKPLNNAVFASFARDTERHFGTR
jgi:hypothetical protein